MTRKNLIIIFSVVLLVIALVSTLFLVGVGRNNEDPIEEITDGLLEASDNSIDTLGDPNAEQEVVSTDLDQINLEPLKYSVSSKGLEFLKLNALNGGEVYQQKLERLAIEPLDFIFLKDELIGNKDMVVFFDNQLERSSAPKRVVSELYEFDYNGVKYWLWVDGLDGTLYVSLEEFENPRQVLINQQIIVPVDLKQVKDQSPIFWMTVEENRARKLVKLDFGKIPFEKWTDLDFFVELINSDTLDVKIDLDALFGQLESLSDNQTDDVFDYLIDYRFFEYYVTENDKVLVQIPGVPNQFVLLNGDNTLLVKLDAEFDVGDGLVTCENSDNICVVSYRNAGLYKIDVNGSEPIAENVSPTIVDKGDGVFDATFNRVYQEFGFDSERLLAYENGQVIIWIDGGKFILGDFNE